MKYTKLDLVQGSPEWLAARLNHVTASNVPSLFGLSPYKTALEYATELLTKTEKSTLGKAELFAKGHQVEAAAREWTKANLGIEFIPQVIVSSDIPCLLASLDGLEEQKGIVFEAKYVGRDALADVKRGILKPHHDYQVQAQLLAAGCDKGIYFAMDPAGDAAVLDVVANPTIQSQILETVPAFWAGILEGRLPEPGEKDVYNAEADEDLAKLYLLEQQHLKIKAEYQALEELVLTRYSGKSKVAGRGVHINHSWRKGNVDYARIPQLKGVDLDRYRKDGQLVTSVKFDKDKKGA
jgi:putative phage-type endonuclease